MANINLHNGFQIECVLLETKRLKKKPYLTAQQPQNSTAGRERAINLSLQAATNALKKTLSQKLTVKLQEYVSNQGLNSRCHSNQCFIADLNISARRQKKKTAVELPGNTCCYHVVQWSSCHGPNI